MRVVWGAYRRHAHKLYAWLISDQLQVSPGARLLARGADGRYTALYAARIEENYSEPAPTGSIVRVLQRGEAVPEIEAQQAAQQGKISSGLRREAAAWQAAGLEIQPYFDKGFDDPQKLAELRLTLLDGMNPKPLLKLPRKEIRSARVGYEAAHGLSSPEK